MQKSPIPINKIDRFKIRLLEDLETYGIRDNRDCNHYAELLIDSLDRCRFESDNKNPKKEAKNYVGKYISIFKKKYLLITDLEYIKSLSPIDVNKMIKTIEFLEQKKATVEAYLNWLFDEFYPENRKFLPPALKFSFSNFALENFFFQNKDKLKKNDEDEKRKKVENDLFNRARGLARITAEKEKIKTFLDDYIKGNLPLDSLKKTVEEMENATQEGKK